MQARVRVWGCLGFRVGGCNKGSFRVKGCRCGNGESHGNFYGAVFIQSFLRASRQAKRRLKPGKILEPFLSA